MFFHGDDKKITATVMFFVPTLGFEPRLYAF
jgi:hypothetical protein